MRIHGAFTAVILLLIVTIPVCADTPVPSKVGLSMNKSPELVANGLDTINVRITVEDNLNQTIDYLPIDFLLENPNLGAFFPGTTNTSGSGVAESVFKVGLISGQANFRIRIQYIENETPQYRYFPETGSWSILIQDPVPDNITFSTTKDWLVANGANNTFARVITYNKTYPIPNLEVDFHVLESEMGSFQTINTTTDSSGIAQSKFTVNKKSGNATLKAYITYEFDGIQNVIERQYTQRIDHDYPYSLLSYNIPSEVSVGAIVPLIMAYKDPWGNPIDNKRYTENVTFMVSSPMEDALFQNNNESVATIQVDSDGNAIAILKASISPVINVVRVDPDMGSVPDNYYFIQVLANRTPVRIEQEFEPEGVQGKPPKVYADGQSTFAIVYTVTDEFFNGVMSTPVKMIVSEVETGDLVEQMTLYSNSFGQVMLTYGPKSVIGRYNITAQAIGNTSPSPPTCYKEIWFVSQEAQDLQFTAVPDSMASRDVEDEYGNPAWEPAMLMAKVIDENGNPVEGETVTFSLGTPVYESSPYQPIVTMQPELVNGTDTAVTDIDGFAIVYFNPGAFSLNWTEPYYDDTATGSCTAYAHWENVTRGVSATQNLVLTWKNYPYLSIETEVAPQTVNVSGIVNVKVSLKGDGWALRPKPIDAVFCTDRSGSMLKDNPDRMVSVMEASKAFVGAMHVGPARDHIGLVTFGIDGWANLSPTLRYLNSNRWCRDYSDSPRWDTRKLTGEFYDWRNVYGVYSDEDNGHTYYYINDENGFWWVKTDSYSSMEMSNPYNLKYWPYTKTYDINSDHALYVTAHYPGNNRNYDDDAVVENHLSADPYLINTSVNMMVPSGGTPMRYGVYRAIKEIISNGRLNAIRAIIILGDGDWNTGGDPLARSGYSYDAYTGLGSGTTSNQNMSNYARNNNIKIFSIGYGSDITTGGLAERTLQILAEGTGGQYYKGDAANIDEIYTTIAGQLQEEAGVNTTMDMGYDQIEVNYDIVTVNETYKVFEYVPDTDIDAYYQNMTRPDHDPPYPFSVDQSDEFNLTHKLNFSVGTVKLGETWEAVYSLRVLVDGTINVFGENSFVYFNGTQGPSQLRIPKTYITGVANMTSEGVNASTLEITVGDPTETETNIITWTIDRHYTGTLGIKENYYISIDEGMTWLLVGFYIVPPEEWNSIGYYSVNRNQFPPKSNLEFRVVANALDAPGPVIPPSKPAPIIHGSRSAYIILK